MSQNIRHNENGMLFFFKAIGITLMLAMFIIWSFYDGRAKVEEFNGTAMNCPELKRNIGILPEPKLLKRYSKKITFKNLAGSVEDLQSKHKEDVIVQTNALGNGETVTVVLTNNESDYFK